MAVLDFGDQVDSWVKQTEQRLEAVFKASVQQVARELTTTVYEGGRLPIITGNLRRSFLLSTAAMPMTASGDTLFETAQDYSLAIASVKLGDKVYMGYQAAYARRKEYGFTGMDSLGRNYNQAGYFFVADVVSRWPMIVAEQALRLRMAVGRRAGAV